MLSPWVGRVGAADWRNLADSQGQQVQGWLGTAAISQTLGVPVRPVMCVHRATVAYGSLHATDLEIVPAGRLPYAAP
jgi:hypothetical protein